MWFQQAIQFFVGLIEFDFLWISEGTGWTEHFLLSLDHLAKSIVIAKRFLSSDYEILADLIGLFDPEMSGLVDKTWFIDFDQGSWI